MFIIIKLWKNITYLELKPGIFSLYIGSPLESTIISGIALQNTTWFYTKSLYWVGIKRGQKQCRKIVYSPPKANILLGTEGGCVGATVSKLQLKMAGPESSDNKYERQSGTHTISVGDYNDARPRGEAAH